MKIDRFLEGFTALHEEPGDIETPILIPGDLDPHERHDRFTRYIDAELRLTGLGSAGGGWQIRAYNVDDDQDSDEEDEGEIVYSMIDADVTDLDAGMALIRENLVELGCPPGTLVQYHQSEDRWDGERWHFGEARSYDDDDSEPWRGPR